MSKSIFHIVIAGPESTGKTSMLDFLSTRYEAVSVSEVARDYIGQHDGHYVHEDLRKMAFIQFSNQLSAFNKSSHLVISDTGMVDFLVWDEFKYRHVDGQIEEWYHLEQVDFYLLMYPDLPWEADNLRENPNHTLDLYLLFFEKIKKSGVPFVIIKGVGTKRFQAGADAIDSILHTNLKE